MVQADGGFPAGQRFPVIDPADIDAPVGIAAQQQGGFPAPVHQQVVAPLDGIRGVAGRDVPARREQGQVPVLHQHDGRLARGVLNGQQETCTVHGAALRRPVAAAGVDGFPRLQQRMGEGALPPQVLQLHGVPFFPAVSHRAQEKDVVGPGPEEERQHPLFLRGSGFQRTRFGLVHFQDIRRQGVAADDHRPVREGHPPGQGSLLLHDGKRREGSRGAVVNFGHVALADAQVLVEAAGHHPSAVPQTHAEAAVVRIEGLQGVPSAAAVVFGAHRGNEPRSVSSHHHDISSGYKSHVVRTGHQQVLHSP